MKSSLLLIFFFTYSISCTKGDEIIPSQETMTKKNTYLALGDSYTIGATLAAEDNFPNQVGARMSNDSTPFQLERIIAQTGWTTDELEAGIRVSKDIKPLLPSYDFVSLLIGVNNQYRGRSVDNYKPEFEELLRKAIQYAGNKADHVVVISIPDWGATPFANGQDRDRIAREIDAYNAANKAIADRYHVHYIDITPWTREAASDPSLVSTDGLHPSAKEYKRWAEKISEWMKTLL